MAVYNKNTKSNYSYSYFTSTGMYNKIINAGEFQNKGIEVQLNVVPARTQNFEWKILTLTGLKTKIKLLN